MGKKPKKGAPAPTPAPDPAPDPAPVLVPPPPPPGAMSWSSPRVFTPAEIAAWPSTWWYRGPGTNGCSHNDEDEWYPAADYAPTARVQTVAVEGDALVITCMEPPDDLQPLYGYPPELGQLEKQTAPNVRCISGMRHSKGVFQKGHGYFEIECKLPAAIYGMWPAFWLLPATGTWSAEIDVFEHINSPRAHYATVHHDPQGNRRSPSTLYEGVDGSDGFHRYGVAIDAVGMTFFVDGVQIFTTPHSEFTQDVEWYLIVNLAFGGGWPCGQNRPALDLLPIQMLVRAIRVYDLV